MIQGRGRVSWYNKTVQVIRTAAPSGRAEAWAGGPGVAGSRTSAPLGLCVVYGPDREGWALPGASGPAAPLPGTWPRLPGSTLTWLSRPSPGRPERAEAGPPAGAQSRPGLVGEAGGHPSGHPAPCHGGRLGVGLRAEGARALGAPGRALKQREPPSECQFGSLGTPSPLNPRWASASAWRRLGPGGPARPSAYKVLEGRPRRGAQQSHTLIAERSPVWRGTGGWGGLGTCAHACTQVHAYRHTRVHTHAGASKGTLACTQPTHVAPETWQ